MASRVVTVDQRILPARRAALAAGPGLDHLVLNPVKRGVPNLDVISRIVTARARLTMEGASTLDIGIHDPEWLIEESGVLDTNADGRMDALDVTLDTLAFRLAKGRRSSDVLTLSFEDRVKALLDAHDEPKTWSRNRFTRAQAIESMVREVRTVYIPFYSPEKGRRMPTERVDYPKAAPAHGQTGFDEGTSFKIKGVTATAGQMREVATSMTVADQEGATDRVKLSMLVAGIGESAFQDVPNAAGSPYGGVFQALKTRNLSTEEQARAFLRGGKGFQGGGAIHLARANKDISVGTIATTVEASGQPGAFYDKYRKEADAILAAWQPGDQTSASGHEVLRVKSYQFTRGQPGDRETSFEAAVRLADEVKWRFYAVGGVAAFNRDDFLMTNPAGLVINGPDDDRLLERPEYDIDHGKTAQTVELRVRADRWEIRPAEVVVITGRKFGPVRGRWLVLEVDQNLLDVNDCTVTLTKPLGARKEPAPELVASAPSDSKPTQGAETALKWARSKLGHYKENWGANRGNELDKLEKGFGFQGAPWCAIFATTAVAQAVGDQCKTAAVAQIRQWAQEGSHGYQKGFRATPRPGDLMCFGTAHVALVEKVKGDQIGTIEGNTSANQVARGGRLKSTGDFVRPDYVT